MKSKAELYKNFKDKTDKELHDFISENMVFAFSKEQHEKVLKELGITDEEFRENYTGLYSGAIRKDKLEELSQIADKREEEFNKAFRSSQELAEGGFYYELCNYEYIYSHSLDDVLGALGVTEEELEKNSMLSQALDNAKRYYLEVTEG